MALHQAPRTDVSPENREMIDEYLKNKGATKVQPFLAPGNEAPRATRELVARRRREFRKANKPVK
jgi:NAD-specific glutamate dehydrogenase